MCTVSAHFFGVGKLCAWRMSTSVEFSLEKAKPLLIHNKWKQGLGQPGMRN